MLTLFRRAAVAAFGVEFLFVFLLGGAVQLIGLLSNTGMTVLLAGMSIAVLSVDMLWRGRLATPSVIVWGMIAAAVLCTSWALAESPPLYLAGSLIWVVVPAATYYLVRGGLRSLPVAVIIKMFVAVSVIQLPVMALQRLFYDQIAGTAVQEIAYVDIVFGTFFVKADHSLSFLLLALIIFALFNPRARTLLPYRRYLIGLWIVTILFTNSHMGHLLLMVVLIGYAFDRVRPRCDRALQVIGATLTIAVVCVGVIIFLASRVPDLQVLSSRLARQVTLGESVARYAVILLILSEPISLLGHGPFSYYNPITKEWGIHGGHTWWHMLWSHRHSPILLC
jgi:hypothetical protein